LEGAERAQTLPGSFLVLEYGLYFPAGKFSSLEGKNKKKNPTQALDTHTPLFYVFLEKIQTYFKVILELFSF